MRNIGAVVCFWLLGCTGSGAYSLIDGASDAGLGPFSDAAFTAEAASYSDGNIDAPSSLDAAPFLDAAPGDAGPETGAFYDAASAPESGEGDAGAQLDATEGGASDAMAPDSGFDAGILDGGLEQIDSGYDASHDSGFDTGYDAGIVSIVDAFVPYDIKDGAEQDRVELAPDGAIEYCAYFPLAANTGSECTIEGCCGSLSTQVNGVRYAWICCYEPQINGTLLSQ